MKKTERERDSNDFQFLRHLCTFHQCNEEVFIQHTKNNKFKNRKEKLLLKRKAKLMHL